MLLSQHARMWQSPMEDMTLGKWRLSKVDSRNFSSVVRFVYLHFWPVYAVRRISTPRLVPKSLPPIECPKKLRLLESWVALVYSPWRDSTIYNTYGEFIRFVFLPSIEGSVVFELIDFVSFIKSNQENRNGKILNLHLLFRSFWMILKENRKTNRLKSMNFKHECYTPKTQGE